MKLGLGQLLVKGLKLLPFSPDIIAGLELWLDATDTTTLNTKMGADIIGANSERLTSTSGDFVKGNESFSFGCWIKQNATLTNARLIGRFENSPNFSYCINTPASGQFRVLISSNGTSNSFATATGYVAGNWNFVVGVYDADADLIKISVNGDAFVTAAHTTGAYAGTAPFMIGGTAGFYSTGYYDGAFFYDKALSQAEVTTLYNSGNGTSYADADTVSLVSWWEMNELSGNRSDSHGTNTLTDNNTVGSALGKIQDTITNNGYVWRWVDKSTNAFNIDQNTASDQGYWQNAKEIVFDGASDNYNIDSVLTPLASTTVGTWAIWVKPTDATPTANASMLSFSDASSGNTAFFFYVETTGKLVFYASPNGTTLWQLKTDSSVFSNNVWCHVAIVQNGTEPVLYVDGVAVAQTFSISTDKTVWFNDMSLNVDTGRLGNLVLGGSGGNYFGGSMGEPLIWDTNLTPSQIEQVYNYSLSNYS